MAQVFADLGPAREWHRLLVKNPKSAVALARLGQSFVKANAPTFADRYSGDALKTKECKDNPAMRREITLAIGLNRIVMGDLNDG